MITIKEVLKNIEGIKEVLESEFQNDVICAFEDYSYKGVTEVIVAKTNGKIDYQAYINHLDAPIICMQLEEKEGEDGKKLVTVTNAWIA